MMSRRHLPFVLAFSASLLAMPGASLAQQNQAPSNAPEPSTTTPAAAQSIPVSEDNFVDVSVKDTVYTPGSDEGRAQRYRDLRGGGTVEFLRYKQDTAAHWFNVEIDHAGYRDQRYSATYNDFGTFKAWFQFNS